jgi:NAD(P)-dependent dehydrogenase (short-subunit alcohol dehydrogenase family)
MELSGRIAIVTGAASGLGLAVALRFAREGAIVVAADTNQIEGNKLQDRFKELGCEGAFVPTDISDEASVRNLFDLALTRYKRVDILYNNAAVLSYELGTSSIRRRRISVSRHGISSWGQICVVLSSAQNMRFHPC